jgi:hypothetical protein
MALIYQLLQLFVVAFLQHHFSSWLPHNLFLSNFQISVFVHDKANVSREPAYELSVTSSVALFLSPFDLFVFLYSTVVWSGLISVSRFMMSSSGTPCTFASCSCIMMVSFRQKHLHCRHVFRLESLRVGFECLKRRSSLAGSARREQSKKKSY